MKGYSLTYQGVIVFIVGYLFNMSGVPFLESEAEGAIAFIVTLIGVLTTIYGRYRKGDLNLFGFRSK